MKKLICILLLFCSTIAIAQNVEFTKENFAEDKDALSTAKKDIEAGDVFFIRGQKFYKQAIPFYIAANQFNPNNALLNFRLGKCYLYSNFKLKAIPHLEKALFLNPKVDPQIHFLLGKAYHLNMKWDKAIDELKTYKKTISEGDSIKYMEEIKKHIAECLIGKEQVQNPNRVVSGNIENVGPQVNSQYNEYKPVISADESVMMFTSCRPNTTGGQIATDINDYYEDIYISTKKDGKWTAAENLGAPVNTVNHDANSGLSADGQKLLIYVGYNNGDLYESQLNGTLWSVPVKMNKNINTMYHESSASYSPDGKSVYFVSDKPGGLGSGDIYISTKDAKGEWGVAVNMGSVINTPYGEESVFIHPDGKTLYFSSQGHGTMGGYDIFKSTYENNKWTTPQNVGYPINTTGDDVFFVVSASGQHGYYSSTGYYGGNDIFMVTIMPQEKQMTLNTEDNLLANLEAPIKETVVAQKIVIKESQLTILKGVVTDNVTGKPVEATIEIIDNEKNVVVATFKSNSATGKYLVSLPAGKNYGFSVNKQGYLFHSENIDIPANAAFKEVTKDITFKPMEVGNKVVLNNIFFNYNESSIREQSRGEIERLALMMFKNPAVKIEISGHSDSKGSDEYNQKLSEARAKSVVDYLIMLDVEPERLTFKGYGKNRPIASNDTDEGRALNRRTEVEIISK
jgi:outer membrane protein OmpA-like peptidoglycan-associated protein/tetratricopeptide (TPR) repeat protein